MKNLAAFWGCIILVASACSNGSVVGPDASTPIYQFAVGIIDATSTVAHDLVVCDSKELRCALVTDTTYSDKRLNFNPAWSPDGRRLAFINSTDGISTLNIAEIGTQDRTRITDFIPDEKYFPAWSPDGTYLAVKSQSSQAVMVMSDKGLVATTLTSNYWESFPGQAYWSGDGSFIAVADGSKSVRVFTSGGDSVSQLSGSGTLCGWVSNTQEVLTTVLKADTVIINKINVLSGQRSIVTQIPINGNFTLGHVSRQYSELDIIKNNTLFRINTVDGSTSIVVAPYPMKKTSLSADGKVVAYVTSANPSDASTLEVRMINIDGTGDEFSRKGLTVFFSPIVER